MRISDWSSDVCSSDLDLDLPVAYGHARARAVGLVGTCHDRLDHEANLHRYRGRPLRSEPVEQRGGKRRRPASYARGVGRHQPPPGHVECRLRTANHPGTGDMEMEPGNQFVRNEWGG